MERLHPDALGAPRAGLARPRYDRARLAAGIVHLGIGAFARAHLAAATEAALHAHEDPRWGIVGVSLRQADTRDALAPQAGLYTLALRDADGAGRPRERLQVIGCLTRLLVAPEDPQAVLAQIAHADTRMVSLTVTEKGYCHDPASRVLRAEDPDILHDLAHPEAPRTALGFIVHGLALRRARELGPVTLLSCDNLRSNGDTLKGLVLAFAQAVDPALAEWIGARCGFPNAMVDRIVPRTTEGDRARIAGTLGLEDAWPVMAEPFFDWAVEDRFVAGRPAWDAGGARFVRDAAPYERLKLRMVNGPHSALAYLGAMAGWSTVHEAMEQPAMRRYLDALMREEIAPTLQGLEGLDLEAVRDRLLKRFANRALQHRTRQIAMDGSQKLPQRLLGTVREQLAAGRSVRRLALAVAAWLHDLRGVDERGEPYAIDDPLAEPLARWVREARAAAAGARDAEGAARREAEQLLAFAPVFGEDLALVPRWTQAVAQALARLRRDGVAATLETYA